MGRVGGGDSHQLKPLTLTLAPDHAPPPPLSSQFIIIIIIILSSPPPRPPEFHQASWQLATTHLYSSGWRDTLWEESVLLKNTAPGQIWNPDLWI